VSKWKIFFKITRNPPTDNLKTYMTVRFAVEVSIKSVVVLA